jgi:hypothetical protein
MDENDETFSVGTPLDQEDEYADALECRFID